MSWTAYLKLTSTITWLQITRPSYIRFLVLKLERNRVTKLSSRVIMFMHPIIQSELVYREYSILIDRVLRSSTSFVLTRYRSSILQVFMFPIFYYGFFYVLIMLFSTIYSAATILIFHDISNRKTSKEYIWQVSSNATLA